MPRGEIDWGGVKRVLVVRLRSIGDTVLTTPSLIAIKRFLPDAEVDILIEDWVAPLLDGFDAVDNVLTTRDDTWARFGIVRELRRRRYDVVFNLHGGTTAAFLTFATGARYRIGLRQYRYAFLHTHLLSSLIDYWQRDRIHSAEQQLAVPGFVGIPIDDRPKTRLVVTRQATESLSEKFRKRSGTTLDGLGNIALIHPSAAFETKEWATEKFASVVDHLHDRGITSVAVAAPHEAKVLDKLQAASHALIYTFTDLSLPEITALASQSRICVGNDSGIAHIAAAVQTPTVVIFGSSNRDHWRPWTDAPNEIVFNEFACQPCPGDICREFGEPKCILSVEPEPVLAAIDRVLFASSKDAPASRGN